MDHRGATATRAAPALSRNSISILAAACGLAVANANYSQPLLVDIGQSLHLTDSAVSLLPALTQLGVSAGILLLLPLGDTIPTRRLLSVAISIQALALAATSLAPTGTMLLAAGLLVGFFGITPYVLETVPNMGVIMLPCEMSGDAGSFCGGPLQASR